MSYTTIHERRCLPDSVVSLAEVPSPKKHREMHVCSVCEKSFSQENSEEAPRVYLSSICQFSLASMQPTLSQERRTRKHPDKKYETPSTYTYHTCQKSFHYKANYITVTPEDAPVHSTSSNTLRRTSGARA